MSKYTLRCIRLPLSPCCNGVLGNISRYITIIVLLLFIQWSMSGDPPSTKRAIWASPEDGKGGRPRSRRYTHVLVLSDTSDTASRVASNGLRDEWSKEKESGREGKMVTCRGKIQVAVAAKTAIATHFVHADVQHRIYCYYLICCARILMNERINERINERFLI